MPDEKKPPTTTYSSLAGPRPEEKSTVSFEQPPSWAIALSEKVARGFEETNANLSVVANDLTVVKERVAILERYRDEAEQRQRKHSGGIAKISTSDANQNTLLAALSGRLTAVEQTVERIDAAVDVTANASAAVVRALGIQGRVELGAKSKPSDEEAREQPNAFDRLDRRARSSTIVQAVISAAVILDIVWRAVGAHIFH